MSKKFEQWAIVEVMGHQRLAGKVTEQVIGGTSFVRVDVPEVDGCQPFTKLLGSGAIYAITIVDEETARAAANQMLGLPEPQQILGGWLLKRPICRKHGCFMVGQGSAVFCPACKKEMEMESHSRNASRENLYLAEMGYAAYAKTTDGKNYRGEPMPEWENLPEPQKRAWINAAAAIRRRVVCNGISAE